MDNRRSAFTYFAEFSEAISCLQLYLWANDKSTPIDVNQLLSNSSNITHPLICSSVQERGWHLKGGYKPERD